AVNATARSSSAAVDVFPRLQATRHLHRRRIVASEAAGCIERLRLLIVGEHPNARDAVPPHPFLHLAHQGSAYSLSPVAVPHADLIQHELERLGGPLALVVTEEMSDNGSVLVSYPVQHVPIR